MDDIRDEISKLSVSELQRKLRESNLPSGPILPSTRPLFERKLAKFIFQSRGGVPAESAPTDATDEDSSNDKDVANGRITYSDVTPNVQRSGDQPGSVPVSDSDTTVTRTGCSDGNGNSGSGNTGPVTYYAVCLQRHPSDEIDGEHDAGLLHVYTMKDEALQVVKKNKGSRFKAFKAREDAVNFSQSILMSPPDSCNSPLQTTVAEKPSDFKAPKMQDLVQLRKAIESGNAEKFSDLVWSNPRYLVSSGDSPVILQMGFRYNALHVAAKSNQAEICQLIIDTLMDSKFLYLMYPDDDSNTHSQRMEYLVDLYLNMPDEPVKGNCETPLHFACKFGHVDVVEVLVSHPAVCKTAKNKQGQIPSEIACMRSGSKETKEKIEILLKDQYYVPLLRPDDDVTVGAIGEPWSPSAPIHQSSPLLKQRPRSPMDPVVTVRAYAGPMVSKEQAEEFHKTWKTPPRHSLRTVSQVKREDSDKGLERLGRDIAQSMKLPWMEFWDFLGCYTNLSTPEGLGILEEYLADRSHTSSAGGHCQHKVDCRNSPMSTEALSESDVVKSLTKSLQLAQLNEDEKMDVGTGSEGTEVTSATELLNRIDASVPVLSPGKDEATADIAAQGSSPREQEDAAISMAVAAPDTKSGIVNQSMGTDNTQFQEKNTFTSSRSLRTSGHQSDGSTLTDVWKEWRPSQSSTVDSFSSSASGDDGVFRSPETFNSADGNQGSTSKPDVCLDEAMSKLSLSQSDELQPNVCHPSEDTQSNFYRTSTVSSQRDTASCDSDKQEPSMAKPRLSVNSDGQADITNPKSGDNARGNDVEMAPAGMQKPVTSPQDRINQSGFANDCFSTPQMSRLNMPGEVSPFGEKIFITGCHPTKLDLDVLRAVNKADSLEEYPHIVKWKSVVNSYSKQTQVSWPSPAASRLRTTSSKQNEGKKYSASPVVYQSPLIGWKNSPVREFKLRHLSEPALKVASPRQRPFPTNLSRSFASQL